MRNKFVSAAKPTDYADQLHDVQRQLAKLMPKIKALEAEEKHLQNYLMRYSKGESFLFVGADGYQKKFKVAHHSRMILDQAAVQRMLKSRTPYATSTWDSVKVDWVYEVA